MAKVELENVRDLLEFEGKEVGVSDWHEVTQEEVNLFAKATGDHQWIHTDPERAERESPYGRTVAHGYYTLSLAPMLRAQLMDIKNKKMTINYGLNRLRFPGPLPVGSKVRLRAKIDRIEEIKGGLQTLWTLTFEVENQDRPACVCEAIYRYME